MGGRRPSREASAHRTNFLTYCVDKRLSTSVCVSDGFPLFFAHIRLVFCYLLFFLHYIKI